MSEPLHIAFAVIALFAGVAIACRAALASLPAARAVDERREPTLVAAGRLAVRPGRLVPRAVADALARAHLAAGEPWSDDASVLRGISAACALFAALYTALLVDFVAGGLAFVLVAPALALGAWLPVLDLQKRARAREAAVTEAMPWMLDLTALAVRSGAALEQAFASYVDTCRDPVLPDEMRRVVDALHHGATREAALARLQARCPFAPVEHLVRAAESSARLGTPIAAVLEDLAARLEQAAVEQAEAAAAVAADKMVGPLVLSALSFVVVILAPFVAGLAGLGR